MMGMIINPGTQGDPSATLANAEIIAQRMSAELGVETERNTTVPYDGRNGWFVFTFKHGDKSVEVQIPGDDPDTVMKGRPWVSRRLYVDGSSWLYGFAVGFILRDLGMEED